jgi:hypothetical protein
MHVNYAVRYGNLPAEFEHKRLLYGLGQQWTDSSCGQSVAMAGMRAQGIGFDKRSEEDKARLNRYVFTGTEGIDPGKLVEGMRGLGIVCQECPNAGIDVLVDMLNESLCFCTLVIQAPWARLREIENVQAGHYVVAGFADKSNEMIYGWESGNNRRWFGLSFAHLDKVWVDNEIGDPEKLISNWLTWIPVLNYKGK